MLVRWVKEGCGNISNPPNDYKHALCLPDSFYVLYHYSNKQRNMNPTTPIHHQLTRDERLRIRTLRACTKLTYEEIAHCLHVTVRQVQLACQASHPTPKKRPGRPLFLKEEQIDRLIEYVTSSKYTRRLSYSELAIHLDFNCSKLAIKAALNSRGYYRYIARRKPPLSDINKAKRLAWASDHIHLNQDQWKNILWTDETWVLPGRHTCTWITRRKDEVYEDTCVVDRVPRKKGWMIWGSFHGYTKGPLVIWEKEWGTINSTSYCTHILPQIKEYMVQFPQLWLMQDGAPGHGAQATQERILELGIQMIYWPLYLPDLNPIKMVWNWIKDFIQANFPDRMSIRELRIAIGEAWESVPESYLKELIESMPERCQAVIDAEGGHTRF